MGKVKNWSSFSQEMKILGQEVRNFELHVSLQLVSDEVKTFFNLAKDDQQRCVTLQRLRGNKEYPFVYFISYFNPNLALTGEEDFTRPLYELLDKEYNIIVKTSMEEISARFAGEFIAQKLGISADYPILIRKRFVLDTNGVPIEYNIGYYRHDSFTYNIESER